MKRIIYIVAFFCIIFASQQIVAQTNLRKSLQLVQETTQSAPALSVRAQTQYNGHISMPEEVVWKREIYRALDLKNEKNASLYYPAEPLDGKVNLFTLLFRLLAEDKIPAYEYRLDGTELMTAGNKIKFKEMLDRFHIYYQQKKQKGNRDTLLVVDDNDIPGNEVLSYFLKEAWYFDQHTSTYNSKVIALCPVLHRAGDFSSDIAKYPMFWIDYKDVSPYLSRTYIMTSNVNNVSNTSIDDYFTARLYKGDIYKTTNMLNQTLAQYCPTDSAMVKEQKHIEGQLTAFEKNLWISANNVSAKDSLSVDNKQAKVNSKKKGRDRSVTKAAKVKTVSTKLPSTPKASVRRQRR